MLLVAFCYCLFLVNMLLNGLMRTRQKVLLEGLGIGAKMVPAIGFAMLLKIMWSKEVAGVFFIGFVMTTYLKLPIMAVAILGASAAALYFFFSGNNKNSSQQNEDF